MKLLVTGGAGFIGANFIHHILEKYDDYHVINIDKLTYAGNQQSLARWSDDDRYRFVEGDICDQEVVDDLVSQVDAIVHFAAESHVDRSVLSAREFAMTNVVGTLTLLDAAVKHDKKRFHHISTDEVFGHLALDAPAFTEESQYHPRSPYSASKAGADHMVRAYFYTHDLPITITNCTNNYGPYHFPEKLIPLAITNIMEGKKVPIYGKGNQIRDWLHVTDHCKAIDLVLHEGEIGETYGVGGDNQPTNFSIVEKLIAILGADPEEVIEYVADRPGHDFRYDIDYTKIKQELSWEPEMTLDEGLKETVAWYQENKAWWKPLKEGSYKEYYEKNYKSKTV